MNDPLFPVWQPDAERIASEIESLASFADPDLPGWTRRPFTPLYKNARQWLKERMESAGLAVRFDPWANLIGRREGSETELQPIVVGSHVDTVIGGGRFDGVIGVLGGVEIARRLHESGKQLRHPLEIVDFTAEETTEFGVSAVGSRGMVGVLTKEMLETADAQGQTLRQAIVEAGGSPGEIESSARGMGEITIYLELHIEQGPVLEQEEKSLGVVTGIVGIRRFRVTVSGQPSHAGTTPMRLRRDALTGAAAMILALESICRERQSSGVVGTTGWLSLEPNAANVVPGKVTFLAEIRAVQTSLIDEANREFVKLASQLANQRGLELMIEPVTDSLPVQMSDTTIEILQRACELTAPPAKLLPSGAGHDANQMARIAPVGMLFVPSSDGLSHCPQEWSNIDDIAAGIEALIRAVLEFDETLE